MLRKGLSLLVLCVLLSSCVNGVITGSQLVYDRHNVYKKVKDFNIAANANRSLYKDRTFKTSHFDVEVFNRDLLIAGQVPSQELKQLAYQRVKKVPGIRRLYNQIKVEPLVSSNQAVTDTWITASIRAQIVADDDINPHQFRVMTENGVVYLMGDVKREQADLVVNIARHTSGVKKVVKIFQYYTYESAKKQVA